MVSKVKLSDYVAEFLARKGITTVFTVSGGASLHLIHSIDITNDINYVCTHHEQGAAMAADGYSRRSRLFGVVVATSGPGATNLITGICCSYYDSVPLLVLTGQVSTFRMTGNTGVRQIGFQETPITSMVEPITKYCVQISDPQRIRYELEKALYISLTNRPGPVLIDIPDNLQREFIEPSSLAGYSYPTNQERRSIFPKVKDIYTQFKSLLINSKRPILIAGWGVHLSNTEKQFLDFAEKLDIPVALTWGASDLLPYNHELYVGTFGTHGMRHANFAVQNSDLILSLGSRLDTKSTGSPVTTFAREAKKIMIDIDPCELKKFSNFGLEFDALIQQDLRDFFKDIKEHLNDFDELQFSSWKNKIKEWKKLFNIQKDRASNQDFLDPYHTFDVLSKLLPQDCSLFIDTGCSIAWSMQTLKLTSSQRVFHDFNNTAMGWSLPASIGSYFLGKDKHTICIIGDGSLMMTVQELANLKQYNIPLKIILINNAGYSMIKQTQDQWLSSKYVASSTQGGLSFPNYKDLARAYNIEYLETDKANYLTEAFKKLFKSKKSFLLNLRISKEARVNPQVKFGRPNEDMEPLLPREFFRENMIIEPLLVSKDKN